MKIVKKKEFYHIQKDNNPYKWKIGQTLFLGDNPNNFAQVFRKAGFSYKSKSGKIMKILQCFKNFENLLSDKPNSDIELKVVKESIIVLKSFAVDMIKVHRENLFEEIRLNFFPNLPSRKRGIWLIPYNEDALNYWKKRMRKGRIFKIRATGKVHNSSENFLLLEQYESFNHIRNMAFLYWAGVEEDSIKDEIIFEGFIEVLELIEY